MKASIAFFSLATVWMPAAAASLPPAVRSGVSGALGRDNPAYLAKPHGAGGIAAGNPRQRLSTVFTRSGVAVDAHGSAWGLRLAGYGYAGALEPVAAAHPEAHSNRVEYRRGPLTEWYVNGPLGLEQGFTLHHRPARKGDARPLTIALEISGDFNAAIDSGKTGLTLTGAPGTPHLRYSGLTAYDAAGKQLPAWLELRRERLLLKVDDRQARYPVVVDPFLEAAELTASDGQPDDSLGSSVALSGDTVVVGAPFSAPGGVANAGAVYVFVKPPGGWANVTQVAKLTASDAGATPANFLGVPVAIDGHTIVAAAIASNSFQGAVYVFAEPAGGWADMTETAKLTASDGAAGDRFGCGTAIEGDVVVAGACQAAVGSNFNQGAAYVYRKPAGGWQTTSTFESKLTALDGSPMSYFGISAAMAGGTVVIGALPGPGAAYVYSLTSGGWTEAAKLTASDGENADELGYSVSMGGGAVVAGAPLAAIGSHAQQGAAYVFAEPAGGWADMTETAKLSNPYGEAFNHFGWAAAIDGEAIAVGAPGTPGSRGRGTVYLFAKPPGGWAPTPFHARLTALDAAPGASFGTAVALDGSTLAIAAPYATVNGNRDQGAAYIFAP